MDSFLARVHDGVSTVSDIVWGVPFLVLLVGTGVLLTVMLRFVQVRRLRHAFDVISGKYDHPDDTGDINHFQALSAALSATIGIGNIAGVGIGIHYGGPGALFWMWITAIFGMASKGVECFLGHHFRVVHEDGSASGGPMYYITKGLGPSFRWLGMVFAFLAMCSSLGSANMAQSNTVSQMFSRDLQIPTWVTGLVMAALVAIVILGGIRRIGNVASRLVPTMCVVYVAAGLLVLILHLDKVPGAFATIVEQAFSPSGATGGFLGSTFLLTLTWGMKRGLFSNEAGQGSAPIAHAAAKTQHSVREGVVAMVGPLIDTIIVCTITGLVIVVTDAWRLGVDAETGKLLNGAALTAWAFQRGLAPLTPGGNYLITLAVPLFAFSTAIAWSYYGDRSVQFLFGRAGILPYHVAFVICTFLGAVFELRLVWDLADVANGLMAAPNLIALIGLSALAKREWDRYFADPRNWRR
jgi:AGCS family alanine or glycine:cation symporter